MKPYYQDNLATLYVGDVTETLREMDEESVHCVVTSPPYWGLREYGTGIWEGGDPECDHKAQELRRGVNLAQSAISTRGGAKKAAEVGWLSYREVCGKCGARRVDRQLGLEKRMDCLAWAKGEPLCGECYICRMVAVFREVRRVLRKDGVCFVNMGDSYNSANTHSGKADGVDWGIGRVIDIGANASGTTKELKPKDLCGVPWRLALALQADGWWLRSDIVWAKLNPMPESVTDRPTKAHEFVFMLTKSARYFWDAEAVKEGASEGSLIRGQNKGGRVFTDKANNATDDHVKPDFTREGHVWPTSRNLRDVWTLATEPSPFAHFATYPKALVIPCVKAGTSEKGCCPSCGAPWVRVVEKKQMSDPAPGTHGREKRREDSKTASAYEDGSTAKRLALLRQQAREEGTEYSNRSRTLGWRPSCECGIEDTIPCTVLDPFAGSGTTLEVSKSLGRRAVGIELKAEYAEIAVKHRLKGILVLLEGA